MNKRVKILRGVCIGKGEDVAVGEVRDLPQHIARGLVAAGQASYTEDDATTGVYRGHDGIADRDPETANGDPSSKGKQKGGGK